MLICERLCQGHVGNIAGGHNNTFLFLTFSKTAPVTSSAGTSYVTRGPVTFERLFWLLAEDGGGGREGGGVSGVGLGGQWPPLTPPSRRAAPGSVAADGVLFA